jgi:hypothetical protein
MQGFGASCSQSGERIIAAMWPFLLWIAILAVAGLVYPRRPRTTAALFVVLGTLSIILAFTHNAGNHLGAAAGVFWIVLGIWYLVKYRTPDARAKHVEYWTANA